MKVTEPGDYQINAMNDSNQNLKSAQSMYKGQLAS